MFRACVLYLLFLIDVFGYGIQVRPVAADAVGPDSFVLQDLLGKGSFGQVYHVKHKTTMVSYAMKVRGVIAILRSVGTS